MKKSLYTLVVLILLSSAMTACSYQGDWSGGSQQSDGHGTHRH